MMQNFQYIGSLDAGTLFSRESSDFFIPYWISFELILFLIRKYSSITQL